MEHPCQSLKKDVNKPIQVMLVLPKVILTFLHLKNIMNVMVLLVNHNVQQILQMIGYIVLSLLLTVEVLDILGNLETNHFHCQEHGIDVEKQTQLLVVNKLAWSFTQIVKNISIMLLVVFAVLIVHQDGLILAFHARNHQVIQDLNTLIIIQMFLTYN